MNNFRKTKNPTKEPPIIVAQIVGKWLGGGVESMLMNYYRHIDRTKVQFDFICDEDSTNIPYEEIKELGGRVILCPPYQKLSKYLKFLTELFRKNNYRIVHSHINTLSVFPLYAAKKAGVRTRIAHAHSTSNKKEWKKTIFKNILRPFSKLYATDCFACSDLAGLWLFGNKAFNDKKITIIPNAIDLDKFKFDEKARKQLRKELDIKADTFVVGHIGRFVPQKNHTFLIDIFNELHKEKADSVLLLIGQGPLEEKIKQKVEKLGLTDSVKFLGQRNGTNKLYSAMDVFVLPSLYEGLPVVGVEAQANGLPSFFSECITKEIAILPNAFIEQSTIAKQWSNKLILKNTRISTPLPRSYNIVSEAKKIKVFYTDNYKKVIFHLVKSNKYSGLEKVACEIISNLKKDYNLYYVTKPGPIERQLREMGITYIVIPRLSSKVLKKLAKIYRPDIIHAHDYSASCISALANTGADIVSHIHNNAPWIQKIHPYSLVYLLSSKKFSKILLVSESIKKEYIFSGFIINKFYCIGNPLDSKKIISAVKKVKKIKRYDICCVARLTEAKNPKRFLDIVAEIKKNMPKIKCVWVGDGELMQDSKEYAKKVGVSDNVEFAGYKDNPYEIMMQSKIFMLTSDWEGFGLAVFEALCLGLPCYVSKVGGVAKLVDTRCGRVCKSNSDFLSATELLVDEKRYNKASKNAINKSLRLNNAREYFNSIKKIYDKNV